MFLFLLLLCDLFNESRNSFPVKNKISISKKIVLGFGAVKRTKSFVSPKKHFFNF